MQTFRLGAGVRQAFLRSADRRVELYGAGDVSFDYPERRDSHDDAIDFIERRRICSSDPGCDCGSTIRFSIGYVARFRLLFLSGAAGVLSAADAGDSDGL